MIIITETADLMKRFKQEADLKMEPPSPISIGPFDVLSYIFEICGEEDYRSSLKIAVVSRHWRDIILSTPRAWVFLDIENCTNDEVVKLYFHRSGQQPLHIYLPGLRSFSLLSNVAGRLQCLSIHGLQAKFEQVVLPNVTRLRVYGRGFPASLSLLSFRRFPALRHLLSENKWTHALDRVSLPPLESLSLVIDIGSAWMRILQSCEDTLTSLKLHLAAGDAILSEIPRLPLPQLRCLYVEYKRSSRGVHAWPLGLETPVLTTYIEVDSPPGSLPLQLDLENVKYLRIDRVPQLDTLPNLRELQLEGRHMLAGRVLTRLLEDPVLCSELTLIDPGVEWRKGMKKMEQQLTEINKTRPNPIRLTSMLRGSDPPGIILHSCGPGCHVKDTPVACTEILRGSGHNCTQLEDPFYVFYYLRSNRADPYVHVERGSCDAGIFYIALALADPSMEKLHPEGGSPAVSAT